MEIHLSFLSFFKQKCQTFAGSSFLNEKISYNFSTFYRLTINRFGVTIIIRLIDNENKLQLINNIKYPPGVI